MHSVLETTGVCAGLDYPHVNITCKEDMSDFTSVSCDMYSIVSNCISAHFLVAVCMVLLNQISAVFTLTKIIFTQTFPKAGQCKTTPLLLHNEHVLYDSKTFQKSKIS